MKILIISPFENPLTGRGDRNIRLETALRVEGHKVTFVTSDFDHGRKKKLSSDDFAPYPDMKIISVPSYSSNLGIRRLICHYVFCVKLLIFALKEQWDVVFVSSIPPELLLIARLLRKRRLIIDVRDIWPDALLAYKKPSITKKIFSLYCEFIYRYTLPFADKIIVVAPGYRNWLRRFRTTNDGVVRFIPLGFRREDFQAKATHLCEFEFCYAGGATPQFDLSEFEAAYGTKKGVIVGSGPMIPEWKRMFPNALFTGPVSRHEALSYMRNSAVLLFPSNPYAQLPNKAFDYFALGYPVAFGVECTRATKFLLSLRNRDPGQEENWKNYAVIEKESLTQRTVRLINGAAK